MRGIILAGGKGTRLLPATRAMNKHMIPVGTRPMIEYPIETLRTVFGVTQALIVSGGEHLGAFADYLGDGSAHAIDLTYRVQKEARGIAHALLLAEDFIGDDPEPFVVVLGDNVFDNKALKRALSGKTIFRAPGVVLAHSDTPERFGVPTIKNGKIRAVTEKPAHPASPYAVTGLYCYTPALFPLLKKLKPSPRGELEISDVNTRYAKHGELSHVILDGFWSDAGTPESLARASEWVASQST